MENGGGSAFFFRGSAIVEYCDPMSAHAAKRHLDGSIYGGHKIQVSSCDFEMWIYFIISSFFLLYSKF